MDEAETSHARDEWNDKSSDWSRETQSEGYLLRQEALVRVIQRHVAPCRALDVGCGSGNLSLALHTCGFDVHGTDLSGNMIEKAVETARGRLPNAASRFRVLDGGRIPFDGTFGLITAIGVFPYVSDYRALIAKLAERLEPEGLLVASNTNGFSIFGVRYLLGRLLRPGFSLGWWWQTLVFARTGLWSGGYVDLRRARQAYSARAFDAMFADAGFRRVDSIDIFNIPWLDRRQSDRGVVQRWFARRLGWVHRGFYRRVAAWGRREGFPS